MFSWYSVLGFIVCYNDLFSLYLVVFWPSLHGLHRMQDACENFGSGNQSTCCVDAWMRHGNRPKNKILFPFQTAAQQDRVHQETQNLLLEGFAPTPECRQEAMDGLRLFEISIWEMGEARALSMPHLS